MEDLDIVYIPESEFATLVHSIPYGEKELVSVEGHMRWVITREDGSRYIIRPEITT